MARLFTPKDGYAIMNLLVQEATGQTTLSVVDSSTFVSAGETVMASGTENVLNAFAQVLGKTLIGIRPNDVRFKLIQTEDAGLFTSVMREVSFYDKEAKPVGWVNTDLHARNLYNGYDNTAQGSSTNSSVGTMWEQDKPIPMVLYFGGATVWDFEITLYPDQIKAAFRNENEFAQFWNAQMIQKQNEINRVKSAFNQMNVLNFMGGVYDLNATGSVVNLTYEFNQKFGTQYTSEQLRTTYLKQFLEFLTARIKIDSLRLEEESADYHWTPSRTVDGVTYSTVLRSTPRANQKLLLYNELITEAEAMVKPEIFNDKYLKLENYEPVSYWQSQKSRPAINVTPAIPNAANPTAQTAGNNVELEYVVGLLFDEKCILTQFQFEGADTTPIEARKRYSNIWYHNMKNAVNNFSHKAILYYMEDPEEPSGQNEGDGDGTGENLGS